LRLSHSTRHYVIMTVKLDYAPLWRAPLWLIGDEAPL
jgi:hypothetical protein